MDQAVKNEWIRALRSGEYKQTKNALQRLDSQMNVLPAGFCCLGVLCEVAVADGVIEKGGSRADVQTYDGEYTGFLPPRVRDWAGMNIHGFSDAGLSFARRDIEDILSESEKDMIAHRPEPMNVADLNDAGVSFKTIANVIERLF